MDLTRNGINTFAEIGKLAGGSKGSNLKRTAERLGVLVTVTDDNGKKVTGVAKFNVPNLIAEFMKVSPKAEEKMVAAGLAVKMKTESKYTYNALRGIAHCVDNNYATKGTTFGPEGFTFNFRTTAKVQEFKEAVDANIKGEFKYL